MQAIIGLERLDLFIKFTTDLLSKVVIDGIAALSSLTRLRLKGTGVGRLGVCALAEAAQRGDFAKLLHLRVETVGVNATAAQVRSVVLHQFVCCRYIYFFQSLCVDVDCFGFQRLCTG